MESMRACSCPITLQKFGIKISEKTQRKEYGSDNTLVRALKSVVSTHAIWIELGLHFTAVFFTKIRCGEYSSLEKHFLYQANKE